MKTTTLLSAFLFATAALVSPVLRAQDNLPDGPGKDALERVCTTCHDLSAVTSMTGSADVWQGVVDDMKGRGADGSDADFKAIVSYLAKNFGPAGKSKPATSTGAAAAGSSPAGATARFTSVSTLIGDGMPGDSQTEVNNVYGMTIGPDGLLYFCDLGNQQIRRMDLQTKQVSVVAGNGQRGYKGDGGPATAASLSAPHELLFDRQGNLYFAERDNNVIRKVDMKTGIISTAAGTGMPGYSGDGGPAAKAQLRQPHCVLMDHDGNLLICDLMNNRIRKLHLDTGIIETYAGTGEPKPTPEGAPLDGTPVESPRTMALMPNGDLYVALREGNSILKLDSATKTWHRIAGNGQSGYSGDGGPAIDAKFGGTMARLAGPKGMTIGPDDSLIVADTESQTIRKIDLKTGIITTILGSGEKGDGPETDPLKCKLNRPHAVLYANGVLYVADSEGNRIRILK